MVCSLARHQSVAKVVKRHVAEAQKITDIGAELSMQLPSCTSSFHGLLSELERRKDEIGLAHYGLSMVKLEEVFLKVASGDMDEGHAVHEGLLIALKSSCRQGIQNWASVSRDFNRRAHLGA